MATILRRMPFFQANTTLRIPNGPAVEVKHDQIVVWTSLASADPSEFPKSDSRIPAVLDLGFNGEFLLREDHIRDWTKLEWTEADFPFVGTVTVHGEKVPLFEASVWMHKNVPGFRDQIGEGKPHRLDMDLGVAVCPEAMRQVRLPLLGLSAIRKNGLRLLVNGEKRHVSLRASNQQLG